jgi:hypothetical protein
MNSFFSALAGPGFTFRMEQAAQVQTLVSCPWHCSAQPYMPSRIDETLGDGSCEWLTGERSTTQERKRSKLRRNRWSESPRPCSRDIRAAAEQSNRAAETQVNAPRCRVRSSEGQARNRSRLPGMACYSQYQHCQIGHEVAGTKGLPAQWVWQAPCMPQPPLGEHSRLGCTRRYSRVPICTRSWEDSSPLSAAFVALRPVALAK